MTPSKKYRGLYRDKDGKTRSAGTFVHKDRALAEAIKAEDAVSAPGWRDPKMGLKPWGEWAEVWWSTRTVEPGTLARQKSGLTKHLIPKWGDAPLAGISRQDVRAWAAELGRTSLSPSSVQRHVHLLSASLAAAVDAGLITANPAARLKLPSGQIDVHRYLTRDEADRLLDAIADPLSNLMVSTLLGTGLRWGEMIGLQVNRLDLARNTLRVAEVWDMTQRSLKAYPKGRKIREVPVPPWLVERLTPQVEGRSKGFVFERNDGVLPDYWNWRKEHWDSAAALVGKPRIHDLRHTYASWLIQDGVSLARVGQLLGHISPATTQVYAHLAEVKASDIFASIREVGRNVAKT